MDYEKDFADETYETSHGKLYSKHHGGGGKKVVFLHGIGANTKAWVKLVEALPNELDVYLLDLLGHGNSDAPRIGYTIGIQTEILNEFIRGHDMLDPCLVGHSYGGWIAAYYAAYYDSLGGLVLMDSAGAKEFYDDIGRSGKQKEYGEEFLRALLQVNGNREYVMRSILENALAGEHLDGSVLGMISTKTLIVWGSEDDTVDIKYGRMINGGIKGSRMEVIGGGGHNSHYSHAGEVGRLLLDFINQ